MLLAYRTGHSALIQPTNYLVRPISSITVFFALYGVVPHKCLEYASTSHPLVVA